MNSPAEKQSENPQTGSELLGPEIWNLPNLITVSRLVLALVLFFIIYLEGWWKTSAAIFILAAATDFLDGYFARKYNQVTTLGRILDPFVDKIIICGAFIFLLERGPATGINAWFVLIIIGREMFITSHSSAFFLLRDISVWSAALITLYSGVDYVFRASRILRNKPLS